MTVNQSTTNEFAFAPGESNITGERFSPNIVMFWLHTAVVISSTRVQYRAPNTILGLIPIGEESRTIPLRNIASVDTSTRFNMGNLLTGIIAMLLGLNLFSDDSILEDSHPLLGFILLIVAIASLLNTMTASLNFANQAGGANTLTVSILEKEKLHHFAQLVQERVFADMTPRQPGPTDPRDPHYEPPVSMPMSTPDSPNTTAPTPGDPGTPIR